MTEAAPPPEAELVRIVHRYPVDPGGVQIRFVLHGAKGAVQFVALDRIDPGETHSRVLEWSQRFGHALYPMGVDVGFHSAEFIVGATKVACDILPAGHCWYDGSSLRAMRVAEEWLRRDRDVEFIWLFLRDEYFSVFYTSDGAE